MMKWHYSRVKISQFEYATNKLIPRDRQLHKQIMAEMVVSSLFGFCVFRRYPVVRSPINNRCAHNLYAEMSRIYQTPTNYHEFFFLSGMWLNENEMKKKKNGRTRVNCQRPNRLMFAFEFRMRSRMNFCSEIINYEMR